MIRLLTRFGKAALLCGLATFLFVLTAFLIANVNHWMGGKDPVETGWVGSGLIAWVLAIYTARNAR